MRGSPRRWLGLHYEQHGLCERLAVRKEWSHKRVFSGSRGVKPQGMELLVAVGIPQRQKGGRYRQNQTGNLCWRCKSRRASSNLPGVVELALEREPVRRPA